jgi:hypothetical protein
MFFRTRTPCDHRDIPGGEEITIKNIDYFNFVNSGIKKITVTWQGEKECENKWLKIGKMVINNQEVRVHNCRYMPFDNEYLLSQRNNINGRKEITRRILFPGETIGWFGRIVYQPYIGTRSLRYSSRTKTKDEIISELISYPNMHIDIDSEEVMILARRKKQ